MPRFLRLICAESSSCQASPAGCHRYSTLRPIWTPQLDRQSALVASSKLATSLGLCRSRKHIGIRVLHADYEAARQVLHLALHLRHFIGSGEGVDFRVSPTPLGATRADVQAYLSKALSCKAHVRHQLSSQAWLVTTKRKPDNLLLHCASCFVLLEEWRPASKAPWCREAWTTTEAALKVTPATQPRPFPEGPTKALVNSLVSALEHKVDGRIGQLEARLEARLKTVEGQAQFQTQRLD